MSERTYTRREILSFGAAAAALPVFGRAPGLLRRGDPVIERIRIDRVPGEFYRPIGMNAYDNAPKGMSGSIRLVQVILSDGTIGLGVEGYDRIDETTMDGLRRLIGIDPMRIHAWDGDRITEFSREHAPVFEDSRYAFFEAPLLDAIGKLTGRPVHALFGTAVRDAVDCYDGTLYFADIANDTDVRILGDLARRIQADGYRAIKQKVGRPGKWMPGEAGVERDIEAVAAVREAVGSNFNLMVDANNGYSGHFDWAVRFLEACDPYELYWMEEIFPEDVEEYQRLQAAMLERGCFVPIAEGESVRDVEEFRPYLEAGLYEVIQPDMRTIGLTNILRGAELASAHGAVLVPHNWQSEMGKLMSIHAGMIHPSIPFTEDDRYRNFAIDASGYVFHDGRWMAPAEPGWGIRLIDGFDRLIDPAETIIIS